MEPKNPELHLAGDFIRETGCHIFLTGKAGTGKTTFLRCVKEITPKRMIVTAPTGVAAINAGGVTIHSFFQMPFGPFIPGQESAEHIHRKKIKKEKVEIMQSLDLLVIDEISMVRADLLDGVDAVLRRYRHSHEPFGGVQLLMIGDLHQLPPVVKEEDWAILRQYYDSPYFFSSNALKQTELIPIELQHIYRQSDPVFIQLLNRVRNNNLDHVSLRELNKRHVPDIELKDRERFITLCTHNRRADAINQDWLAALAGKNRCFEAEVEGEFPEYSYPAPALLELKERAQVMFVRNDSSSDKLYYNGKIGAVTKISSESIRVKCPGDAEDIVVEPVNWENIQYSVDPESGNIVENKIGVFRQFPLKPAWAITIHKSQGLTFEKAIIDARAAFAHGQVYVALSRCKTLEGMVLSTPISSKAVKTDAAVADFTNNAARNPPTRKQLAAAKIAYQQRLLLACFDCKDLQSLLNRFVRLLTKNIQVVHLPGAVDLPALQQKASTEIFVVGENFKRQLQALLGRDTLPESDPVIRERTTRASGYFQEKIEAILMAFLEGVHIDTDNKELGRNLRSALNTLHKETVIKLAAVQSCRNGFAPAPYLRAISAAEINYKPGGGKKAESIIYSEADVGHPELFQELKNWRTTRGQADGLPMFRILHQRVLIQIAVNLPDTLTALQEIHGIGARTAEKYGEELVALVSAYRKKHGITDVALPEPAGKPAPEKQRSDRSDTKQISFAMFMSGLSVERIAAKRGLVRSTIERHLRFFVDQGKLDVIRLVDAEKKQIIEQKIVAMQDATLGEIKKALGDDYSYGEIKLVFAHRNYVNSLAEGN
ncbi:MAG: helix-turn-helix domain-containing protein [Desulfobulbaceae bacterium]|nr:helix-turn-helix domain-containing protein [Desulfobulbaceae bacterium]